MFVPLLLMVEQQVYDVDHIQRAPSTSLEEPLMMSEPDLGSALVDQKDGGAPRRVVSDLRVPIQGTPEVYKCRGGPRGQVGLPEGRSARSRKGPHKVEEARRGTVLMQPRVERLPDGTAGRTASPAAPPPAPHST